MNNTTENRSSGNIMKGTKKDQTSIYEIVIIKVVYQNTKVEI